MKPTSAQPAVSDREELREAIASLLDVSVAVLDANGVIVEVSGSWTRFSQENGGRRDATGVGVNYIEVCRRAIPTCSDAQKVIDGIFSVMSGTAPRFSYEYRCDAPDALRWFVMTVARPTNRGGVVIAHQNDTQVRAAEVRYGALLDSVRAIVWRAEAPTFHTTFASRQAEEILGFPVDTWTTDPELWRKQLHPEDRDWVLQYTSQEVAAGRKHSFEYRVLAADGHVVWLRNIVNVIVENGKVKELVGISTDVTERRQAEAERDLLAIRLLRSQEEERTALARELHDDIGQSVALLGVKLQVLNALFPPNTAEAAQFEEAQAYTDKLAKDVQRISRGLHPSSLDLLGLAAAIAQHCREYASHHDAEMRLNIGEVPRDLDRDIAACLFRVLQECLRNVTKHSRAKNVTVKLAAESNHLKLEVADDGVGFDPQTHTGRGLGLVSMSERLRLVRGKLTISSTKGRGTHVTVAVPIR